MSGPRSMAALSQSPGAAKKAKGTARFRWTAKQYEHLLACLKEYKSEMVMKGLDFDIDSSRQHEAVRVKLAKLYSSEPDLFGPMERFEMPSTRSVTNYAANRERAQLESLLIKRGHRRVQEKVKEMRQAYVASVSDCAVTPRYSILQEYPSLRPVLSEIYGSPSASLAKADQNALWFTVNPPCEDAGPNDPEIAAQIAAIASGHQPPTQDIPHPTSPYLPSSADSNQYQTVDTPSPMDLQDPTQLCPSPLTTSAGTIQPELILPSSAPSGATTPVTIKNELIVMPSPPPVQILEQASQLRATSATAANPFYVTTAAAEIPLCVSSAAATSSAHVLPSQALPPPVENAQQASAARAVTGDAIGTDSVAPGAAAVTNGMKQTTSLSTDGRASSSEPNQAGVHTQHAAPLEFDAKEFAAPLGLAGDNNKAATGTQAVAHALCQSMQAMCRAVDSLGTTMATVGTCIAKSMDLVDRLMFADPPPPTVAGQVQPLATANQHDSLQAVLHTVHTATAELTRHAALLRAAQPSTNSAIAVGSGIAAVGSSDKGTAHATSELPARGKRKHGVVMVNSDDCSDDDQE